jgi:hydroxymethylglutaryl-CoA synthase
VGRLEVGTETLIDKSKSVKTVLMDLFPNNSDLDGATVFNACYGGTAALLNAVTWCQSDDACCYHDDDDDDIAPEFKYAIVVAADIAVYSRGPARPTSGIGAVAMLVGRDAPLVIDLRTKATFATNVYDFYKPNSSEYPVVDGAHSQNCYYTAVQTTYAKFCRRLEKHLGTPVQASNAADFYCFHAPYNKLVQKSFARLFYVDAVLKQVKAPELEKSRDEAEEKKELTPIPCHSTVECNALQPWLDSLSSTTTTTWQELVQDPATFGDKALEQLLKSISAPDYTQKLHDANVASQYIGNTYTASVFFGLLSLLDRRVPRPYSATLSSSTLPVPPPFATAPPLGAGQSIALFSYGSGAIATMYRILV